MNPEFRRNLWLELTPRRIIFMVGILALVFFAASVTSAQYGPANAARTLYMLIVVLWGTRNAALSVVGEIRDRTWDGQRLSSIGASQMTWGKLFGATIYNWFGGAICLAVMLIYGFAHNDPVSVLIDLVYLVALGLIAQSASLLASLIAVRRRQSHSRLDVFLYQLAGLIAAVIVSYIWAAVDPAASLITGRKATEFIVWWGATFDSRPFLLMSLSCLRAGYSSAAIARCAANCRCVTARWYGSVFLLSWVFISPASTHGFRTAARWPDGMSWRCVSRLPGQLLHSSHM